MHHQVRAQARSAELQLKAHADYASASGAAATSQPAGGKGSKSKAGGTKSGANTQGGRVLPVVVNRSSQH
jgi:hypothetical protein